MEKRYTAIIVDDERPARIMLRSLLEKHNEIIEIVEEAGNGKQAIELINEKNPDLIFLDIHMSDLNGFEVLAGITNNPMIIFTTAYDQYALDAFRHHSIDYLLKPIEGVRLDHSIQKLKAFGIINKNVNVPDLLKIFIQSQPKKEKVALPIKIGSKIILVRLSDIAFCESRNGYVSLISDSGKEYVTDYNLHELEEKLPHNFLRVQKSFIINKDKIKEIQKYFNNRLIFVLTDVNHSKITTGTSYRGSTSIYAL